MTVHENRFFVDIGEEIEVRLTSVPSSGHDWHLVSCPPEIEFVADSYVQPIQDGRSTGGVGAHIYHFRATVVGTFTISFALKRNWEQHAIGRRVIEVHCRQ